MESLIERNESRNVIDRAYTNKHWVRVYAFICAVESILILKIIKNNYALIAQWACISGTMRGYI